MEDLSHTKLRQEVQSMHSVVIRAKVQMCRKLIADIKKISGKKPTDQSKNEKNTRKIQRLRDEVHLLKNLKPNSIAKFALSHSEESLEGLREHPEATSRIRALSKISLHKLIKPLVEELHKKYPKWEETIPKLIQKEPDEIKIIGSENIHKKTVDGHKLAGNNGLDVSDNDEDESNGDDESDGGEVSSVDEDSESLIARTNQVEKSKSGIPSSEFIKTLLQSFYKLHTNVDSMKSKLNNNNMVSNENVKISKKTTNTTFPLKFNNTSLKRKRKEDDSSKNQFQKTTQNQLKPSNTKMKKRSGVLLNKWEVTDLTDSGSLSETNKVKHQGQDSRLTEEAIGFKERVHDNKAEDNLGVAFQKLSQTNQSKTKLANQSMDNKDSNNEKTLTETDSLKSLRNERFSKQSKNMKRSISFKVGQKDRPSIRSLPSTIEETKTNFEGQTINKRLAIEDIDGKKKRKLTEMKIGKHNEKEINKNPLKNEKVNKINTTLTEQHEDPFFLTKDNKKYMTYGKIVDESKEELLIKSKGTEKSNTKTITTKDWGNKKSFTNLLKGNTEKMRENDGKNFGKRNIKDLSDDKKKLHPSWEAKKKITSILPFQGKKISFDD